jgi:hypothetical protein
MVRARESTRTRSTSRATNYGDRVTTENRTNACMDLSERAASNEEVVRGVNALVEQGRAAAQRRAADAVPLRVRARRLCRDCRLDAARVRPGREFPLRFLIKPGHELKQAARISEAVPAAYPCSLRGALSAGIRAVDDRNARLQRDLSGYTTTSAYTTSVR